MAREYTAEQLSRGIERARAAGNAEAVAELEAALAQVRGAVQQPDQAAPVQPAAEIEANPMGANVLSILRSPMGQEFLGAAQRQVPPMLAGIRTAASATPQGLAYNIGATGLTAALAELGARFSEGQDITSAESLGKAGRAAIEFGAPGPILGGLARFGGQNIFQMGGRAVVGTQGGISKAAQSSLLTAGSIMTGREAEGLISGKPATKLTRENVLNEVVYPSLVSGLLTGTAQTLGRMGDIAREVSSRRAFLASVGVNNPTLGALMPERFGQIELATDGPASSTLRAQRALMRSEAEEAVRSRFNRGNYASNETVANYINPQIDRIAAADDAYQATSRALEQANARYAAAEANTQLSGPQRAQVLQDAREQVYRAIQERANTILDASNGMPTVAGQQADRISGSLRDLLDLRSRTARELYAPLRQLGAVFEVDEIEQAARRGMSPNFAQSQEGQSLLASIRNYRGDGVIVNPSRPNPAAQFDPSASPVLPEEIRFDLEAVRQMREHLSDIVDGMDRGVVGKAEREASQAYNAINDAIRSRLVSTGGPDLARQWDTARGYWASSFRAMEADDPALRMLVKGRATVADIDGVADRLINRADASTIGALSNFTDVVSGYDPLQRNLALGRIGSAITNRLIWKNSTSTGTNWSNLFEDVLRLSRAQGIDAVFPIERLGLGTRREIASNRAVVRDFARRGLTDEAIGEAFASPLFVRAVESGTGTTASLTRALAEAEFRQRVMMADGMLTAGLTAESREQLRQAETARRTARMTDTQARQRVEELQLDPAYQVLMGQTRLSNAPEVTANRIGDLLLRSETQAARRWVANIQRTDPEGYNIIATNTLANFLEGHLRTGSQVSFESLRQQFSNRNTEFAKLSNILPESTMNRLAGMPDLVRIMDDTLSARPVSDSSLRRFSQIFGLGVGTARAIRAGTTPGTALNTQGYIRQAGNLIANGSYHIVAHQLMNPDRSLITPGATFAEAVARLPTQQGVILMNNERLAAEMARADEQSKRPRQ